MSHFKKVLFIVSFAGSRVALAQGATIDPQCTASTLSGRATQDACQKAIDVFHFMSPQLSTSLVGGNLVAGEAKALGGLGHVSVGIRANVLRGHLPNVGAVNPAITGAVPSDYSTEVKAIGLPVADIAVGVLPGFDLGGTKVLSVDGLMNLTYIPEYSSGDFKISVPSGSLRFGFGARVGLSEESGFLPSVSIAFLERDLPSSDVTATPGTDLYGVRGFTLNTNAWRVTVGKSFGPFTFVLGAGKENYDASGIVDVTVNRLGQTFNLTGFEVAQSLNRSTFFGDVSLNLPVVKVVAEIGQANGGSLRTYNTFGDRRADDALQFASLGLRLRW